MGKLRKLRKAILADPTKWRRWWNTYGHVSEGSCRGCGARYMRRDKTWTPAYWKRSYRSFVESVLREVGNADVRPVVSGGVAAPNLSHGKKPE
jgi:hypothetical protein